MWLTQELATNWQTARAMWKLYRVHAILGRCHVVVEEDTCQVVRDWRPRLVTESIKPTWCHVTMHAGGVEGALIRH